MVEQIFDAHAYIGSDYHTYFNQTAKYTLADYKKTMDKCNIKKAVLVPGGYEKEIDSNYEIIKEAVRDYPEKYYGFYRAIPRLKEVIERIEQALNKDHMKGIMLHPHWDTYLANSPQVEQVFEFLSSRNVPVLFYTGDIPYTMPAQVADIAVKFPTVPIIMGHSGKTELYQHSVASALRCPNIYLETSGCNVTGIIEDAINKIGADRVLFGSGWPGMSPQAELTKLDRLSITDDQKEAILWGNMNALLS